MGVVVLKTCLQNTSTCVPSKDEAYISCWAWFEFSDSFLMNRIQQKCWYVTSEISLDKHCCFNLGFTSFSLDHTLWGSQGPCHDKRPLERPTYEELKSFQDSQENTEAWKAPCVWDRKRILYPLSLQMRPWPRQTALRQPQKSSDT